MAWAHLSDVRCYYETLGCGEPLLLIPGLGATVRSFDPVLAELAQSFSVIAPDNRGIGHSVPRCAALSVPALVADLVELLDHLQVERTHVLGLSFGGLIAQRLAVDHPSRVDRLVLVSCTDRFSPYLRQISLLLGGLLRRFPRETFVRVIELLGSSPDYTDSHEHDAEERIQAKCQANVSPREVARQLQCVASCEIDDADYHISAPTLVIAGEYDVLIPSQYARRMADKIPGSRFVLLSGAGHNPLEECPGRVMPLITGFLSDRALSAHTSAAATAAAGRRTTC